MVFKAGTSIGYALIRETNVERKRENDRHTDTREYSIMKSAQSIKVYNLTETPSHSLPSYSL